MTVLGDHPSSKILSHYWHSITFIYNHPEGDIQIEHANQTLEQYIPVYCNYQQDWLGLLPLAKFAYNNTPSTTTGVTLFFTNNTQGVSIFKLSLNID